MRTSHWEPQLIDSHDSHRSRTIYPTPTNAIMSEPSHQPQKFFFGNFFLALDDRRLASTTEPLSNTPSFTTLTKTYTFVYYQNAHFDPSSSLLLLSPPVVSDVPTPNIQISRGGLFNVLLSSSPRSSLRPTYCRQCTW